VALPHEVADGVEPAAGARRAPIRPDIQGMRAIAVMLVILWHASVPGLSGGFIGVDVFFVISGYVITDLLRRQDPRYFAQNLRNFYARRIRRIVPAATVVLVVTTIAAYIALGGNMDPQLLGDVRWSSLFFANVRFISTATPYNIPGIEPSLVSHFWSLAVEEQFYLVWPLVVFSIGFLIPLRHRKATLAAVLAIGVIASSWWSIHETGINPVNSFYSPFTRFWELALGALVSLAPVAWSIRSAMLNAATGAAALVGIAVCAFVVTYPSAWPGALAWWPCSCAAVLLFTGRHGTPYGPTAWLSWSPATYIGDISYSLYLWHYLWLALPLQFVDPPDSAGIRILEVAGAVICAAISYHFLENPIRRSKRLERDPASVFLLLAVCVALTWAATFVVGYAANLS
jgi:peptidoglycan/LPS O-acetylase OafA/YrhL